MEYSDLEQLTKLIQQRGGHQNGASGNGGHHGRATAFSMMPTNNLSKGTLNVGGGMHPEMEEDELDNPIYFD